MRGGDLRATEYAPLSEGTDMQRDRANWENDEVIEAERYHAGQAMRGVCVCVCVCVFCLPAAYRCLLCCRSW